MKSLTLRRMESMWDSVKRWGRVGVMSNHVTGRRG